MGVLAVGIGKVEEAIPFKKALEVNSSISQFWLSYIDALIKLDRIEDAKVALDQARNKGAKRKWLRSNRAKAWFIHFHKFKCSRPTARTAELINGVIQTKQVEAGFKEAQTLTKRYTKSLIL